MGKIKNGFHWINGFVKQHFLMGLIILFGFWYFFPNYNNPASYTKTASNGFSSYAQNESIEPNYDDGVSSKSMRMRDLAQSYIQPVTVKAQFEPGDKDRKIIKNASLQLEVEETEEAKTITQAEVLALEGYITNQNSWEVRPGTLAYNMTIRVPSQNLENLIENLTKVGLKKGENYSINDITAQYRDTDNQIKNLETRRDRLRKLMEFETENLNDVLQVDRELTKVQNQIDNMTRTQRGRDVDVDYSTLQLSLNPEAEIGDFNSPEWNLEKSWKQSVNDFIYDARKIVDKLIKLVIYTPIWLPVLLVFWGFRRWRAKRKARK